VCRERDKRSGQAEAPIDDDSSSPFIPLLFQACFYYYNAKDIN